MEAGRLYAQSLADAVTLYWCKPANAPIDAQYEVFLDGKWAGRTEKTHFTADGLCPQREYHAEVRMNGDTVCAGSVNTAVKLRRLDVQGFGAVGDGAHMDTVALQAAINACGVGDEVYLPAGTYKTGALRLHSDMALYLEHGAVLQGTDEPGTTSPTSPAALRGRSASAIPAC